MSLAFCAGRNLAGDLILLAAPLSSEDSEAQSSQAGEPGPVTLACTAMPDPGQGFLPKARVLAS